MVMECLDGGDLSQQIAEQAKRGQFFTEQFIWSIFLQIVKGLEALHQANILHRDIKVLCAVNVECKCLYDEDGSC